MGWLGGNIPKPLAKRRTRAILTRMIGLRGMAGGRAEMEAMAAAALQSLPERFRAQCDDVVIKVEEFATREQLDAVGIEDCWDLTGLYEGRPLSERSIWDAGEMPAVVTLFRQPLLDEWRTTGVRLDDLVTHVVIHELGHHFGFSDDTMHRLEDGEEF